MDRNYEYSKKLSELGYKIKEVYSKYIQSDELSIANLKNRYNNILIAINEYKKCKTDLNNIICPPNVRVEHEHMVDAIELFIEGTKAMANAVETISEETLQKGISLQKLGVLRVGELSDEIANKLIK